MNLHDVPAGSRFLDVDGIPVVMLPRGPDGLQCIAFAAPGDGTSRPYPNVQKAGTEGDELTAAQFAEWVRTGKSQFA